jgi:hypothetical protein
MTSPFASSIRALGLCDRCGFTFRLNQLQREMYDRRENGLLTCPSCTDIDHPQLQLGLVSVDDPQSLQDPRPDIDRQASTSYFGWAPVGNTLTGGITGEVGTVTVLTS